MASTPARMGILRLRAGRLAALGQVSIPIIPRQLVLQVVKLRPAARITVEQRRPAAVIGARFQ